MALGQSTAPALLQNLSKKIERNQAEMNSLGKEQQLGLSHEARLKELNEQTQALIAEQADAEERWQQEKALTEQIKTLRANIEAANSDAKPTDVAGGAAKSASKRGKKKEEGANSGLLAELAQCTEQLKALQGEAPLVAVQVDGAIVAEIVSSWTGIPLGKMVTDEINTVLKLDELMQERVIGQPHAISAIAQRVRTSRANLDDPNKPKGVFLLVGPSGVGKTETALALADILYGGERKLVTINMSEYQEAHSVSGLKGSPPGYVGYGEGSVLTEAVRRNPYSVVLLDEVEKAHPDVLELFFQVFDKGVLDDAEGREIDFKNTIIILTSNVGSSQMMQACLNKSLEELPSADELEMHIRPLLVKTFKPAFLGRLKVIPYYPLADEILIEIIKLKLSHIQKRIHINHKAELSYDNALVEAILARCTEVDSGARNVDNILSGTLLPEIAENVLNHMAAGTSINVIKVGANKQGNFKYSIK